MRSNFALIYILLLLLAMPSKTWAEEQVRAEESSLQAAFLFNFALLTEWPSTQDDQFNICVLGNDPILQPLKKISTKQVKGMPINLMQIHSYKQTAKCRILFVADEEHASMGNLSRRIGSESVMVITRENAFDPHDTIIMLVREGNRIGFAINQSVAIERKLTLSSKLLKLAKAIY